MTRMIILAFAFALIMAPAISVEAGKKDKSEAAGDAKKKKIELVDVSVEGTVSTKTVKNKKTDKEMTRYLLTTTAGKKIMLPQRKGKKGGEPKIKLADYADKTVKVEAKDYTKKAKNGKEMTVIKVIKSITGVKSE